jgi:putative ABC transport system substrate-binding protein
MWKLCRPATPRIPSGNPKFKIKNRKAAGLSIVVFLLVSSGAIATAQQPGKMPRVGYISGTGSAADRGPYFEALRQGLEKLGYTEGKNIAFEYRGAEGKIDTVTPLVKELVDLKVDVLVVPIAGAIRDAKRATKTIPIVIVTQVDPVATGLVASLARPGGNITGVSTLQRDLSGKRLELLKEVVPGLVRVGILRDSDPESLVAALGLKDYEAAAQGLKLRLQSIDIRGPNPDFDAAFRDAVKKRIGALVTITSNPTFPYAKRIADLALKHRLPSMFEGTTWVEKGGLLSYSANELDLFRRAATYVDKILKGTKPADLPVEQPTKFEFAINLKTAKALNLNIPQSVLFRADKVIK